MNAWAEERNKISRARLEKALPAIFPAPVLVHAYGRPLIPPLPRLAMESYWRAHPLRADRLARALARRSGAPEGWAWRLNEVKAGGVQSFRVPPTPYREAAHARGPGHCCVCGQPVFRFGWHTDLWGDGKPNARATWHAGCVAAWKLWLAPVEQTKLLRKLQKRRCAATGGRLLRGAEVDHRVPLFQVWRDERHRPWPDLLAFWGFPNLQAVGRAAHAAKSAEEASGRAKHRRAVDASPGAPAPSASAPIAESAPSPAPT